MRIGCKCNHFASRLPPVNQEGLLSRLHLAFPFPHRLSQKGGICASICIAWPMFERSALPVPFPPWAIMGGLMLGQSQHCTVHTQEVYPACGPLERPSVLPTHERNTFFPLWALTGGWLMGPHRRVASVPVSALWTSPSACCTKH